MPPLSSVDIYVIPEHPVSYTLGVAGVTNIQVMSFFANCVHIKVFFGSTSVLEYFQFPCVITYV